MKITETTIEFTRQDISDMLSDIFTDSIEMDICHSKFELESTSYISSDLSTWYRLHFARLPMDKPIFRFTLKTKQEDNNETSD